MTKLFALPKSLKRAVALAVPWLYRPVQRWRWRRRFAAVSAFFAARGTAGVALGPFAGMAYLDEAAGSMLFPKLAGTYEAELHSVFDDILRRAAEYERVVDVGCAEGYYAVGLARRMPVVEVSAFDLNDRAQHLCRQLAEANGVAERVRIGGGVDATGLCGLVAGCRALIVCDIEGDEDRLLDAAAAAGATRCDLLVELHERTAPGVGRRLVERFATSHDVREIPVQPRRRGDWPHLRPLSPRQFEMAVNENRLWPQSWLWMTSRSP